MAAVTAPARTSSDLTRWLRALGKVAFAGAATGFLIGGVGGRLAMLLLRVTSSDALHGLQTDDDFTIGVISSATIFLLGITTFLGLAGGLVYAAVRGWFPAGVRPAIAGIVVGLTIGADLVTTDGVDFRLVTPTWLAIVLFVAIPTTYGVVMSVWVERWLANERTPSRPWVAFLPLVAFLAGGPFGVALVVLLIGGWAVAHAIPALATVWSSPPVAWIGRILLAVVTVAGALELVHDVDVLLR